MSEPDYKGLTLDERYELIEELGSGGMAHVYKARDHRLDRYVAVKILKDEFRSDEEFLLRFRTESRAVAMLSHPNIVAVYDVSSTPEAEYMVMELLDGIDLKTYITRKGLLTWKETLHFTLQIAKALKHAHSKGIIHRDIKPQNIMVLKDATVKVADFGIARFTTAEIGEADSFASVHYISPEQVRGGRVDARTDIYSLGVVMYEMLTSAPPYDAETEVAIAMQHIDGKPTPPRELNPDVPLGLQDITLGAMEPDLALRYQSADTLLRELEEFRRDPTSRFLSEQIGADGSVTLVPAGERRIMVQRRRGDPKVPEMTREQYRESRRRAGITALALGSGIILVILVFLTIFLWSDYIRPWFYPEPAENIPIPNFYGKKLDSVSLDPQYVDFSFTEMGMEYSAEFSEPGYIIRQDPVANDERPKIDTGKIKIRVWLSGGSPNYAKMPNVLGISWADAQTQLQRAALEQRYNINIQIESYQYDSVVPVDKVIETKPPAGDPFFDNMTVFLVISLGQEPRMPSLVERTYDEAIRLISANNLLIDETTIEYEYSDEFPKGIVFWQSIEPGEVVVKNEIVKIKVSLGPPIRTVEMPRITGINESAAIILLQRYNLYLGEITLEENDAPMDSIFWQSVPEGEEISEASFIDVKISTGPPPAPPTIEPTADPGYIEPTPPDDAYPVDGGESGEGFPG